MTGRKVCFVIAPMGKVGSDTRHRSERVFEHVIKPATKKCHYTPQHPKDDVQSGFITTQIINHVVYAPLVIADLTGGNANVFYELALRHAVGKPVVLIMAKNEEVKFDIGGLRVIIFDIDDVDSTKKATSEIVRQIQMIERSDSPFESPISAAHAAIWTPFPNREKDSPTAEMPSTAKKYIDDVLEEYLEILTSVEATPSEVKHLVKELMESTRVRRLKDTGDDLDAACTLVKDVPDGGYISATSSLQHHDADERLTYRTALNDALQRNVTYRKVICSSSELTPGRYETWQEEFTEKADLIRQGSIEPNILQLLHYPSPMSVDVLISQDSNGECLEMIAGFAGGEGHGGFSTDDKKMVGDWLDVYLEKKIIAPAKQHTEKVLNGLEECPCLDFLNLLEEARRAAPQPEPQPEPVVQEPRTQKHPNRGKSKKRT